MGKVIVLDAATRERLRRQRELSEFDKFCENVIRQISVAFNIPAEYIVRVPPEFLTERED